MEEKIMLEECPICRGAGMIFHEGGWNVQVECTDCSAHTVFIEYGNEERSGRPSGKWSTCGTSERSSPVSGASKLQTVAEAIRQTIGRLQK